MRRKNERDYQGDVYRIVVVSIEILSDNKKMYIFNVYLPYDKLDNEEEYIDRLAKLHNILAECDSTCVAVVGDYNANVLKKCLFCSFVEGIL